MAIAKRKLSIDTTGGAGAATGSGSFSLPEGGIIKMLAIDYHASAPVTTDIVIKDGGASGDTIITRSSTVTDLAPSGLALPGVDPVAGGAVTAANAGYTGLPVAGPVYVSVAQCDALTAAVVVTFWVEV